MQIFNNFRKIDNLSLALGYFDGVHLGHGCVIKNTVKFAEKNSVKSAVITFKNSPTCFFSKKDSQNIISLNDKLEKIEKLGVDYVFVIDFDKDISLLTAENYLNSRLITYFTPKAITTGFNHTFGSDKATSAFLKENQKRYNYKYFEIPPITYCNELISSTAIKNFIAKDNFVTAKNLLGYDFYLQGKVIEGDKLGRTISFPTANVQYPENILKINTGAYVAKVIIDNKNYQAILNYGKKPTIAGERKNILEAHILNFNDDIYDKCIKIIPLEKIRNEQKFHSLDLLKIQLQKDTSIALLYFKKHLMN